VFIKYAKLFAGYIVDFIKPEFCPICGIRMSAYPSIVCEKCRFDTDLSRRIRHVINESDDRHLFIDESVTLFPYKSVRELILAAKYKKRNAILHYAGEHLGRWILTMGMTVDIITYVPMRYGKLIKRGTNPSGILAAKIASETGIVLRQILGECPVSGEQKLKSREGRFAEIVGRFYGLNQNITGKTIVLVDDVMTTGATLNECGRILKKMGAEWIISITIAEVGTKTLEKK
jgi:competence protein ComFC